MIIEKSFNAMEFGTEFLYLGSTYKKISEPNGKIGAIDLKTKAIYHKCNNWKYCTVFIPDEKEISNRETFSIINSDNGELLDIISLTPSQVKLLKWLDNRGYLSENLTITETAPKKVIEI